MTAGDVVNRLSAPPSDLGTPGRDARFGFGAGRPGRRADRARCRPVGDNPLDDHRSARRGRLRAGTGSAAATVSGGGGPGPAEPGSGTGWAAGPAGQPRGDSDGHLMGLLLAVVLTAVGRRRCWPCGSATPLAALAAGTPPPRPGGRSRALLPSRAVDRCGRIAHDAVDPRRGSCATGSRPGLPRAAGERAARRTRRCRWPGCAGAGVGHRRRLGGGQREAGVRVVGRRREDHAEHVAVRGDQRAAGVAAADQRPDRVDLAGHLGRSRRCPGR